MSHQQQYPPPAAPVYAGGQPPRRKSGWRYFRRTLAAGGVLLIVAVVGSAIAAAGKPPSHSHGGALTSSGNTAHPPQDDVTVTGCTVDTIGLPHAAITITNHSGRASDYLISTEFLAGATRVAEGAASQSAVAAGQIARTEAIGDQEVHGTLVCRVTKVDRLAS